MVKSMDNEVRVFGYCEECGNKVTDEYEEYYMGSSGEVFCCAECALEHYSVTKAEV
jgi:hypothetical protein